MNKITKKVKTVKKSDVSIVKDVDNLKDSHEKILEFYNKSKRAPSYSETAEILGYKSKESAYRLVEKLVESKYLFKDHTGKIIIRDNSKAKLKILGYVEAGFPTPAEEQMISNVSLDDYVIENRSASFMLRVSGDSMIDAGIMDGDMVIVERTSEAKTGQIVVAEVDGGYTLKYLRRDKNRNYYLEPANKDFTDIYPEQELSVQAVLRAVVRKY